MKNASESYKASYFFIFISVVFIGAVVIIVPVISNISPASYKSSHIVISDGLIYKLGEDLPYSGRVLDTLENKILEYDVVNGLKNGEFKISTIDGTNSVYGFIENNKNVGVWKYFYENGNLESIGGFQDDKPMGKWTWYYQNGKLKSEGIYILGQPDGKWLNFDNEGYLVSIIHYLKGEIIGELKFSKPKKV
jgi:antitoxin component YwqK of YwqJK toxin-antitoxin module